MSANEAGPRCGLGGRCGRGDGNERRLERGAAEDGGPARLRREAPHEEGKFRYKPPASKAPEIQPQCATAIPASLQGEHYAASRLDQGMART